MASFWGPSDILFVILVPGLYFNSDSDRPDKFHYKRAFTGTSNKSFVYNVDMIPFLVSTFQYRT